MAWTTDVSKSVHSVFTKYTKPSNSETLPGFYDCQEGKMLAENAWFSVYIQNSANRGFLIDIFLVLEQMFVLKWMHGAIRYG